jgi:hypothetical protein
MILLEEPLSQPLHLYFQRNCARSYPVYLYEVIVPGKEEGFNNSCYTFLLLTLQPFVGFGLLHQIIPGFSFLDELALISQFQFL